MNNLEGRKRKYLWENKLSMQDRESIVLWYMNGYAIKKIADTLRMKAPTIQYHLKVAGVFTPNKKPVHWGEEIPSNRPVIQPNRGLAQVVTTTTIVMIGTKVYPHPNEEEAKTFEMQGKFPKNYIEYLKRAKARDISYQHYNPNEYGDNRHLRR